jgi:hypothetical protein
MASCPAPGGDPEAQPVAMVDMWFQDENGKISRPASDLNNSQSQCSQSHQTPSCHFEDDVFHSRVLSVLHQHSSAAPPSTPLFLFWAPHACHGPREVPAPTYDEFAFIDDPQRRMYCALMHYLDSMIGNVVDTMQEMGMWSNTLFVFASDNVRLVARCCHVWTTMTRAHDRLLLRCGRLRVGIALRTTGHCEEANSAIGKAASTCPLWCLAAFSLRRVAVSGSVAWRRCGICTPRSAMWRG